MDVDVDLVQELILAGVSHKEMLSMGFPCDQFGQIRIPRHSPIWLSARALLEERTAANGRR